MTIELRIYENEVYARIYKLMESEMEKARDRSDEHALAVIDVLLAKIRALEKK